MNKWKTHGYAFNEIIVRGVIIAEPRPIVQEGKKPFLAVRIAVPNKNRKFGSMYFNLKIYGQTAEDFAQNLHRDDVVAVRGPLQSEAFIDKNGKPRPNNFVMVYEWEQCPVDAFMQKAIKSMNKAMEGGEEEEGGGAFEEEWDGEW